MNDEQRSNREDAFNETDERLIDFYSTERPVADEAEREAAFPILSSLKNPQERYQDIELIAEGGEKKITCVYDRILNRKVAVARSLSANNPETQEQFLREALLESNLAHPNIISVHNAGLDAEGTPFFSMELLPDDNLKSIIKKIAQGDKEYLRDYPLTNLLDIFLKACDAIDYAHSRDVLHLDIKPENIQVGHFGEVLVCDWGLARIGTDRTSVKPDTLGELDADLLNHLTLTGMLKGSPGYMAPEQTRAEGEKTVATDIYGLGATLYTILTLQNPIQGDSTQDIIRKTQEGKIGESTQRLKTKPPKGLMAVALKAMSLTPDQRYPNVKTLKDEINRYLSGYATAAEHAGPLKQLNLLIQRHSRTATLLLLFLSILMFSTTYYLNMIQQKAVAAEIAKQEAETNLRNFLEQQTIATELNKDLTESLRQLSSSQDVSISELIDILQLGQDKELQRFEKRKLLTYQATLHFILQEFNAAIRCIEALSSKPDGQDSHLLEASIKFAELKPDDSQQLTMDQLTRLVLESKKPFRTVLHTYRHHMKTNPNPSAEEYLPLAKAMLDRINHSPGKTPPFALTRTPEGLHLDLSQYDYYTYTLSEIGFYLENILTPLNLHSLNISNTPMVDPSGLNGLKLDQLQMNGVSMTRYRLLGTICQNMELKKLIIDKGVLPNKFLTKLRKEMEIIVHPSE